MDIVKALEWCIKERGLNKSKLAEQMGLSRPQVLINQMNRKTSMRAETFIRIADALGYDVTLKDRDSGEEIIVTEANAPSVTEE